MCEWVSCFSEADLEGTSIADKEGFLGPDKVASFIGMARKSHPCGGSVRLVGKILVIIATNPLGRPESLHNFGNRSG